MGNQSAGEKTEKATPKKRKDAREKGQVFKSTEAITAFSLLILFGVFAILGGTIVGNTKSLMRFFFSEQRLTEVFTTAYISDVMSKALVFLLQILAPILIAAFVGGFIFNVVQVGFKFSAKAMKPKMERISIGKGFKRIFSSKTLIELLKAIIKIAILGGVAYTEYNNNLNEFTNLMGLETGLAVQSFVSILISFAFKLAIALAIFAPFDYLFQRWKFEKDLMMTKQEVKDEYKQTEGDPKIKGKIQQKQRQISNMRMVQAVKDADVVITNPTHYAIALSYKEESNTAPMVIAKGKDYLAMKIKEKAKELNIEIVENKPLAQSLYFFCETGDEVPEELYKAVAEILAYVYGLKNNRR